MGTGKFDTGSNTVMNQHPIQGGLEILLVASCYRNWDKLWPDGLPGSYAYLKQGCQLAGIIIKPPLITRRLMDFFFVPHMSNRSAKAIIIPRTPVLFTNKKIHNYY